MLKKTMTYTDFNGTQRTEDFYFHLSKPELLKMMARFYPDVLTTSETKNEEYLSLISKIVEDKTPAELVDLFEYIILKSYGRRSADGKEFEKTPDLEKKFSQMPVYSDIFMELLTNNESMKAFFNGVLPKDMADALPASENIIPLGAPAN